MALVEAAKLYSLNRGANKDIRAEDKFSKIQQKVSVNVRNAGQIHKGNKHHANGVDKEEIRRDDNSQSHMDEVRKKVANIKYDRKIKVNVKDDISGDNDPRRGNRRIERRQFDDHFSDSSVSQGSSSEEDMPARLPDRNRVAKYRYGGGPKPNGRRLAAAKGCVTYCAKKHKLSIRECVTNCRYNPDSEDREDSDGDSGDTVKRTARRVIAASDVRAKRAPTQTIVRGSDDNGDSEDNAVYEEQDNEFSDDIDDDREIRRVANTGLRENRVARSAVAKNTPKDIGKRSPNAKVAKDTVVRPNAIVNRPPFSKSGAVKKPPVGNDPATEETDVQAAPPVAKRSPLKTLPAAADDDSDINKWSNEGKPAAVSDSIMRDALGIKRQFSANGYKEITKQRINQNFDVKVHENHGLMAFSMPNEG